MFPLMFLVIFFLYGGVQLYFASKAIHAFGLAGAAVLLVYAWAALMAVGPLLNWRLERCADCHVLAVSSAWIVFGWMGFSFLFFWLGLATDFFGWAARLGHLPLPGARLAFVGLTALAAALWLGGFYSAWHPRVERITIVTDKLPPGASLRIVQISDLHLGVLIGKMRLDRLLDQIEALQPDILVSTGDLVDAEAHFVDGLSARFAAYRPRLGKFAVTGNHERYAGLDHALDFHVSAGFRMLRGEAIDITPAITLAGVDDPAVRASRGEEARMLAGLAAERFVVLLKHQPVVSPGSRFDLQLSGHTHNGQIFPFSLLVRLAYPMIQGLHTLAGGGQLYVSRGMGTWGPPIRILAPPEITLIEIRPRP